MTYWVRRIAIALVVVFAIPDDAHAYLDPGTGAFLLQWVVALGVGAIVGLRQFWRRGLRLFWDRLRQQANRRNAVGPDAGKSHTTKDDNTSYPTL